MFFVGDSAGPLPPAVGRGDPHRVLLRHRLRAASCARCSPASSTREPALARYARVLARATPAPSASRAARCSALIPALPPRALTALLAVMGRARPCRRAFTWYLGLAHPSFAGRSDRLRRHLPRIGRPMDDAIAFDERGLVPCVIQDWAIGRGADARLHERRGARAHARDRRAAPVEPLARRALAQGRDVGQHPGGEGAALRLRRRRRARARRARRARLPHRRAHVLPQRRPRAAGAARGAARPRAHDRRARGASGPSGSYTAAAARRPGADRREGPGGGRGGRPRRARGDRRARGRGGRRRALPPRRAAALARPQPRRRRGGARAAVADAGRRLERPARPRAQPRPGLARRSSRTARRRSPRS